ncbi:hypothetical protein [Novosphingobium mangrovi (ex Hu et al. 2023)]|uniref:Uncharacterized protein n=1 Tax=Novosphingobium mangrovi (ex Hu et al. 2023) TaxID=2930094 RepID=A0ABT0AI12_9SPHN|nr:hypothetical protein [Novosphingobium mangrovi (ex Hu et al. 2023)]MCJ1962802.1 hypothetical protein [Novosphingobium mangrovi (ex Hu et al. 2023)]
MREPDLQVDGWCLDDGEVYHAAAPDTFWSGIELPFQPRHVIDIDVIDIDKGDANTRARAQSTPRRRWPGAKAV